jgi:hypothetical protein
MSGRRNEPMKTGILAAIVLVVALGRAAKAEERLVVDSDAIAACLDDIQIHCGDVVPGEGRIKACIKQNVSKLTPGCAAALGRSIAWSSQTPPDYASTAQETTFGDLRGTRYCELLLAGGDPVAGNLYAEVFNTSELNKEPGRKDTCPAAVWGKVDAAVLEKEYDLVRVFKNGPRAWVMDSFRLPVAPEVRTFRGLDTRWFMKVDLPKADGPRSRAGIPYAPATAFRNSQATFLKGKPIFILEDTQGTRWVMQSYSTIVDRKLTYDGLPKLGQKLKLPQGWKYRTKVLDRDLDIRAVDGVARVLQDNLQNTYEACLEKACSYQP